MKRLKTEQAFYQIDGSLHINEKDKFIHKLETGNTFLPMLTNTQNSQRITEQLRLEGTLKVILFQFLCHGQGCPCSALISNSAEIRTQRSTAEMLYIKYINLAFLKNFAIV